jgi:hypothetical protein
MGFFDVFKKSRKQVNRENQEQGKAGERKIREKYEFSGGKVTRTGKGHDFKVETKDWFGNKTTKHIEVKTGNSKLSKLQKKKQSRLGDKYVVERLESTPFGLSSNNRDSDLTPKQRKKKSSSIFGGSSSMDSIFGGSSAKKKTGRKKKSDNLWGSSSSTTALFGSGSSTTKKKTRKKSTTKKKSDNLWGSSSSTTALFGSGSPKKRKKKSDSIW